MNSTANKANAAFGVAAVTTLIAWGLKTYAGVDLPAEVQGALTSILGWLAVYFIPNKEV